MEQSKKRQGDSIAAENDAAEKKITKEGAPEKQAAERPAAEKAGAERPASAKPAAAEKTAAKKTAAKKPAAKKTAAAAKKPAAKKTAAKKTAAAKKPVVKKTAAKRTTAAAKNTAAKNTAAKKPAAKKTTAAAAKTAAEKPAAEKPAVKKTEPAGAAAANAAPEKMAEPEKRAAERAAAPEKPAAEKKSAAKSRGKKDEDKPRPRRVLMASPECVPFANTGGLGEVAGSLPAALNETSKGRTDCRVIMPLYADIADDYRKEMKFLGCDYVQLAWRSLYMGVFELEREGVTYYFIDNEYYFGRSGLYGYYDDGERFAFFSRAVLDSINITGFVPDIIHANDWQTALVPVLQNSLYRRKFLKTVLSIHNIEYQGYFPAEFDQDIIGLPEEERHVIDFKGDINLMKGGIEAANILCTVSPTYAEELKNPLTAYGLDEIIRRNAHKLHGILNGIDTKTYDPATDPKIAKNYSSADISGKKECKKALQRELALDERDVPVITMVSRLVPSKGL
ncbi:MAG: glycogen/starch synthase, partial [Anaerovoracaceae bacterium]|nr:glycogen/starch synthase [Anaerovoracaceae bacterium]